MTRIQLEAVRKTFGQTVAVDSVSTRIESGELFFLLGPSGCGKTTLLRMIAGFVKPDGGRIRLDDRDITDLPAEKRNTGMVFQNYALWPHMTILENVAFGLSARKVGRAARHDRAMEALQSVRMKEYASRRPNELSGGQQQRIALARALVVRPQVLLLDEPLSNLDAKLRSEMRAEIRRICKETGITTVYVTHDQKEALSMADDIAVMRAGQIVQLGSPRELYDRPASRFVADFLGETNFLHAVVEDAAGGALVLDTSAGPMTSRAFNESTPRSGNVTCSIRPEAVRVIESPAAPHSLNGASVASDGRAPTGPSFPNRLIGRVVDSVYLGEMAQSVIELPGEMKLKIFELNPRQCREPGAEIVVEVDPRDVVVLND